MLSSAKQLAEATYMQAHQTHEAWSSCAERLRSLQHISDHIGLDIANFPSLPPTCVPFDEASGAHRLLFYVAFAQDQALVRVSREARAETYPSNIVRAYSFQPWVKETFFAGEGFQGNPSPKHALSLRVPWPFHLRTRRIR